MKKKVFVSGSVAADSEQIAKGVLYDHRIIFLPMSRIRDTIKVNLICKSEAIPVFHAFQKKSPKTPTREINLVRQRLQEIVNEANKY